MKLKLVLLAVLVITGCARNDRFQQIASSSFIALDTKTGERCLTGQKPTAARPVDPRIDTDAEYVPLPYCSDLTKQ